jgi:putative membrane protein
LARVSDAQRELADATRRTWLASERTWLAWWRSGIAVGAVAVAVGRFLPAVTSNTAWLFRVLGVGYGTLSVVILVIGAVRQQRAAEALRRGEFEELSPPLVYWLTGGAVALSVVGMVLVALEL